MILAALPDAEDDRVRRFLFVGWTQYVLDAVSREPKLMVSALAEPAQTALRELQGRFEHLAIRARGLEGDAVAAHGLDGAQLGFKLATVRYWTARANAAFTASLVGQWRDFVRRLLTAIDTLLDSILKALSFDSSVKEVKDAIRDAIKDANDDEDDD